MQCQWVIESGQGPVSLTLALGTQGLLISFGPFNDGLDVFFLLPPCFIVAPPVWSFVFAVKPEVTAGFAFGLSLITLLTS